MFATRPILAGSLSSPACRPARRPPRRGAADGDQAHRHSGRSRSLSRSRSRASACCSSSGATFGGPVPLKPEGYRVKVPVQRGGPARGRVRRADLERLGRQGQGHRARPTRARTGTARWPTIEIDDRVRADPGGHPGDPAREDAAGGDLRRADPGRRRRPEACRRAARCRRRRSRDSVQLDEIFRTFDERPALAFQIWMQQAALAIAGPRRRSLGRDRQPRAVRRGRQPAAARARHAGERREAVRQQHRRRLRGAERASGPAPGPDPERRRRSSRPPRAANQDLREAFRALPTFLDESRQTLTRLDEFARDTDPLITQLHPSAMRAQPGAPIRSPGSPRTSEGFFVGFRKAGQALADRAAGPANAAGRRPAAAARRSSSPFTQQLTPIVDGGRPLPARDHRRSSAT